MKKSVVLRLEYLAFVVSYKEFISTLLLCPDHHPEEKKLKVVSSALISVNPLYRSEKLISYIRDRFEQHIAGTMSDEMRKAFVERFNENSKRAKGDIIDVWVFLDCILDETFLELEIPVSSPYCEPNVKLGTTIAKRSSQLHKLSLDFTLTRRNETTVPEKLKAIMLSLSSLRHLTSLTLKEIGYEQISHRSVLKFVGKSCPQLTHLCISTTLGIRKRDMLAIILGELIDDLFPDMYDTPDWATTEALSQIVVPFEYRTPLCFSLRYLDFGNGGIMKGAAFSRSTAAFVLRNIPFLEMMEAAKTSQAITILNATRKKMDTEIQALFNDLCLKASNRSCFLPQLYNFKQKPMVAPHSFACFLSLKNLYGINIRNKDDLRSIGAVCPFLEEIGFDNTWLRHEHCPKLIESIMSRWSNKIHSVTVHSLAPEDLQLILKVFGPQLKSLTIEHGYNINFADFVSCSQLESLRILSDESSLLISKQDESVVCASTFLPKLKYFESGFCLGSWSSLFEEKSALTRIVLRCCHIGTNASIHSKWSDIPKMWPQLETLKIRQCAGLTMPMLTDILPKMPKLKNVSFPGKIRLNEPNKQLALNVVDAFTSPLTPIHIRFRRAFPHDVRRSNCPLLNPNVELNSPTRAKKTAGYFYDSHDTERSNDGYSYYSGPESSLSDDDLFDPCLVK